MELPKNPFTTPLDENPVTERLLGATNGWPRWRRLLLALPLLGATLTIALSILPAASFWLAMGYFGALHRWVIEDAERPAIADAWVCALLTLLPTLVIAGISWKEPGPPDALSPADRLWWPLAIVAVALALDRVRRRPTATQAMGTALAEAGRQRQATRRRAGE